MRRDRRTVLSIVVPTRNEASNVAELVTRVSDALRGFDETWEIVFVDDSDDSTPEVIEALARAVGPVRIVHRRPGERAGGLSGAVLEGFAASDAPVFAVLDADLQHPPELLTRLVAPILADDADVVVATRYAGTGTSTGLAGIGRRVISSCSRMLVHLVVPRARAASDPLGGFFALRWDAIEGVNLRPAGFKILLEVLARGRWRRLSEVPYDFAAREAGESKAGLREGVRFAGHLVTLVGSQSASDLSASQGRWRRLGGAVTSAPVRVGLAVTLVVAAYWYPLGSLVSAWNPSDARTVACAVPFIAGLLLLARARPAPGEPAIHDRQVDYLLGISALAVAVFMLVVLPRRMDVAFWVERLDVLSLPIFVAGLIAVLFGTRALWRVRWALLLAVFAWPTVTRVLTGRIAEPLSSTSLAATRMLSDAIGSDPLAVPASSTATMVLLVVIAGFALLLWARPRPALGVAWLASLVLAAWGANVLRLTAAEVSGAARDSAASRAILGSTAFFVTAGVTLLVATMYLVARRDRQPRRTVAARPLPAVVRPGFAIGLLSVVAVATGIVTSGYGRFEAVAGPLGDAKVDPLGAGAISVPGYVRVADRDSASRSTGEPRRFAFAAVGADPASAPVVVDVFAVSDPGVGTVASLRAEYPLRGAVLVSSRSVSLGDGRRGDLVEFQRAGGSWTALSWVWPVRGGASEPYERIVIAGRALQNATATVVAPGSGARGPEIGDAATLRRFGVEVVHAELAGVSSQVDRVEAER